MIALLTISFIVLGLLILSQIWAKVQSGKIEEYKYEVLEKKNEVEIRKYAAATFSYVTLRDTSYRTGASAGFQKLGGYIFGNNNRNEKIKMTAPVVMEMNEGMVIKFLIPSKYSVDQLPIPSDRAVKFMDQPERIVASIQFGGFASDERIAHYKKKLTRRLAEYGIEHKGEFSYFGYNSPYDFFFRKNEVIVELS